MITQKSAIRKLFLDTHMGLGHDGLVALARKEKVSVETLGANDLLMFLNRAGDKMKLLGAQGRVIGYLKLPRNQKIMLPALQYIPQTFGSDGFDYNAACKTALEKKFGTKLN